MNLLVCLTRTPETTARIEFSGSEIDKSGIKYILNPYDEWYALVRALELKEKNGGTVTVLNVGPKENEPEIRKALAIGADKAVRIDTTPQSAQQTAKYIADYASTQNFDIIFLGKESIDYNGSVVGAMVSEYLELPFVSYAAHLEFAEGKSTVTREIEGGIEIVEVEGQVVISAAKGMAEQRIPNMMGIMKAKRKPLEVITPNVVDALVSFNGFEKPPVKSAVKMIDPENMDELVRLLREEAKVI